VVVNSVDIDEIIVVNDGSKDKTVEVVKKFSKVNLISYHENKCKITVDAVKVTDEQTTTPPDVNIYAIVNKLISENQELRKFILEQSSEHKKETHELITKTLECCKPTNVTNNNTINGNVNNKFNLNVFLNEQCKDAINFADFVKNIEITYEDLENNAQLGFVNGISKIFLDNLKQLGINERPIHCTDVKRETMYIKDEDKWTKETDDAKLQKAIQTVSYRSMGKLAEWKNENPDYKDCNSEFSQKCLDIQKQTLAGSDRGVYYPKVIHALAREVVVDK
jgi:glycosyltransferase involved in cell wall biosynthesis